VLDRTGGNESATNRIADDRLSIGPNTTNALTPNGTPDQHTAGSGGSFHRGSTSDFTHTIPHPGSAPGGTG